MFCLSTHFRIHTASRSCICVIADVPKEQGWGNFSSDVKISFKHLIQYRKIQSSAVAHIR